MFKFQLEPVLRYRRFLEDQKLAILAEKQRIHEREKAAVRQLREMRAQYFAALREESAKEEVSVTVLSFYQSYIFFLDRRIVMQEEVVAKALLAVQKAQQELVEAKKEKEIMIKLKERAHKAWRYEEDRQEQIMLDDVATIKYSRTKSGLNKFAV